jgi:hypothetical protein
MGKNALQIIEDVTKNTIFQLFISQRDIRDNRALVMGV